MDKKFFAAVAVGILILAGVGFVIERAGSQTAKPANHHADKYPIPPPNVAVATGPKLEAEPSIAISPLDNRTMVAGAIDWNTPGGNFWCGYYTSHDHGRTWKQSLIGGYPGGPTNSLTGYGVSLDPVILADSKGNFYYSGIAYNFVENPRQTQKTTAGPNCVYVAKSTNNGDSFDQVTIVWEALAQHARFNDKPSMEIDPINGNIYLVWSIFIPYPVASRIMFSRSTDGGKSWSRPVTISEAKSGEIHYQGAEAVVDRQNTIHVIWVDFMNFNANYHGVSYVNYASSTDKGNSFSTPARIATFTPIPDPLPNSNYRMATLAALSIDRSNTNTSDSLYVAWPDYATGDSDILLIASHDRGKTWTDPVRVNNDPEGNSVDQFMPSVAVSGEGWVHVGFYDRRCDPNNTLLEYWWAISFDGGQTFPINIPMSNTSFDGSCSGGFIGDYTTIVATNETVAGVWCDCRNGSDSVASADIYGAVVPYKELLRTNKFANVTIPWPDDNKE